MNRSRILSLMVGFLITVSLTASSHTHAETSANVSWKQQMLRSLNTFETLFENRYSAYQWKTDKYGFDLKAAIEEARSEIEKFDEDSENFLLEYQDDYQRIITKIFKQTKDYHVAIIFDDTRTTKLPFEIRSAVVDGKRKFFIVYIDEDYKKGGTLQFAVGDEITHFDGKPVEEVVNKLKLALGGNTTETDQSLAERSLTYRRGGRGEDLPENLSIRIKGNKKGGSETFSQNVAWKPTEDEFRPSLTKDRSHLELMSAAEPLMTGSPDTESKNKHALGARVSFLPKLGSPWVDATRSLLRPKFGKGDSATTIGEALDDKGTLAASEKDPFDWYITNLGEKKVGYIRIPAYSLPGGDKQFQQHVKFFAALIQHMEEHTDSLVIDQLNNPGGSVFYLYALVSTLSHSGDAIPAPKHRMVLTQSKFKECKAELEKLDKAKTLEEKLKAIGEEDGSAHGYPVDENFVDFARNYCNDVVREWERSRSQADPESGMLTSEATYIWGVDEINPYKLRGRVTKYSKPILLLVNELDFSGGDFFPATLQDATKHSGVTNVTVMGTRTAGAGGYIGSHVDPILEDLGVQRYIVTQSISSRINESGQTIENLGVTPDVNYTITAEDHQSGYQPFAKAIKDQLQKMMSPEKEEEKEDVPATSPFWKALFGASSEK